MLALPPQPSWQHQFESPQVSDGGGGSARGQLPVQTSSSSGRRPLGRPLYRRLQAIVVVGERPESPQARPWWWRPGSLLRAPRRRCRTAGNFLKRGSASLAVVVTGRPGGAHRQPEFGGVRCQAWLSLAGLQSVRDGGDRPPATTPVAVKPGVPHPPASCACCTSCMPAHSGRVVQMALANRKGALPVGDRRCPCSM